MKTYKIILITFVSVFFCVCCQNIKAQSPYKASIGAMLPAYTNTMGVSSKFFLTDNIALQADLLYHVILARYAENGDHFLSVYAAIELNTNVVHQRTIKKKEHSEMFWFVGGGVTLGYEFTNNGKFGINAITGLEWEFAKSLSLQVDIRPGYGMLFNSGEKLDSSSSILSIPDTNPWSHFDWAIGFSLRKILKSKVKNTKTI